MTEHEQEAFESRLEARLRRYADVPVRPVDADAVAHEVIVTSLPWRMLLVRRRQLTTLAWLLIALGVALGAVVLGARLLEPAPAPDRPLVLATERGLFLADADGGSRLLLRGDNSFINPRWSPTGDRIAVIHDPTGTTGSLDQPSASGAGSALGPGARELLVLDEGGATLLTVPGPVADFAWGPIGRDGRSLLAIGTLDGGVVVRDSTGATVAELEREPFPVEAVPEPLAVAAGLAWASPTTLLVASGDRVLGLDVSDAATTWDVAGAEAGRINAIAVSPVDARLAYVVAPCAVTCPGEVRTARIAPPTGPHTPGAVPPGLTLLSDIEASAAVSWSPNGSYLIAWPLSVITRGQPNPPKYVPVPDLEGHDIVAAWTRYASDGSGRVLVFETSDTREAGSRLWIAKDGLAELVDEATLGADLRPVANRRPGPSAP